MLCWWSQQKGMHKHLRGVGSYLPSCNMPHRLEYVWILSLAIHDAMTNSLVFTFQGPFKWSKTKHLPTVFLFHSPTVVGSRALSKLLAFDLLAFKTDPSFFRAAITLNQTSPPAICLAPVNRKPIQPKDCPPRKGSRKVGTWTIWKPLNFLCKSTSVSYIFLLPRSWTSCTSLSNPLELAFCHFQPESPSAQHRNAKGIKLSKMMQHDQIKINQMTHLITFVIIYTVYTIWRVYVCIYICI